MTTAAVATEPLDWTEITGWLSRAEGNVLRSFAAGKRVLEFGSYMGRSTVCMGQVATHVMAVDHHEGDEGTGFRKTFDEFSRNIERFGISDRVNPLIGRVESVAQFTPASPFDVVFVDAAHDAENVAACTRLAVLAVKSGGTIFWHDWNMPSVREGVFACGVQPTAFLESLAWVTV